MSVASTKGDGSSSHPSEMSGFERMFHVQELGGNRFQSNSSYGPYFVTHVFGGQLVAQAMMAAALTLGDEHRHKMVHSVHVYFLKPAALGPPIVYEVSIVRDGRSYSTRSVVAVQEGNQICTCLVSFHAYTDSLMHHQVPLPSNLPPLEDLYSHVARHEMILAKISPQRREELAKQNHGCPCAVVHRTTGYKRPTSTWDSSKGAVTYFKLVDPLVSTSLLLRQCVAAYFTDYLVETARGRHMKTMRFTRWTSLDHSIWFHNDSCSLSDWTTFVSDSPMAGGGRGLNLGRLYSADGNLIATCMQEGAYRISKL